MGLLKRTFTWWDGQTWGTWLFTRRKGERVGSDDQGNIYFRERGGNRRWVNYAGEPEASRIPPEWHAWLHYTVALPPSEQAPRIQIWEKPHLPNLTGTSAAYFPAGSLSSGGTRAKASGDYEAWSPDE